MDVRTAISVGLRKFEVVASVPLGVLLANSVDSKRPSPDGFKRLADVTLYAKGEKRPDTQAVRDASVIFISNHNLERFLEEYGRSSRPKVLILGDGDRDWSSFDFPSNPGLKRVFLQNLMVPETDRVKMLPIGIESRKYGKNGMPWMYWRSMVSRQKKEGIYFGPLGNTHPVRDKLNNLELHEFESSGFALRHSTRMSAFEFAWRSSEWTHVATPRGNGQDTHRFWETLYRGSVPIVVSDQWSLNLQNHGIPFQEVSSWSVSEIRRVINSSSTRPTDPKTIPGLWMDYWKTQIRSAI